MHSDPEELEERVRDLEAIVALLRVGLAEIRAKGTHAARGIRGWRPHDAEGVLAARTIADVTVLAELALRFTPEIEEDDAETLEADYGPRASWPTAIST